MALHDSRMSGSGNNGSVAEGSGNRASVSRKGTRGSARLGFEEGADALDKDGKSRYRVLQSSQTVDLTPEMRELEQVALLAKKQAELESVVDKHDDLVRELFHMENFTMMLSYDPSEAKTDNTAVFREYKSKYDLIDNTAPIAGPSRQTRGRLNERRQFISAATISAPQPSIPLKRKAKAKPSKSSEILETLHIASGYKGKGKEKEGTSNIEVVGTHPGPKLKPRPQAEESAPVSPVDASTIIVRQRRTRDSIHATISTPMPETIPNNPTKHLERPRNSNGRIRRGTASGRLPLSTTDPIDNIEEPPPNDQIGGINGSTPCHTNLLEESISVALARRSGRLKEPPASIPSPQTPKIKIRLPVENKTPLFEPASHGPSLLEPSLLEPPLLEPPVPSIFVHPGSLLPTPSKVKRIKLIVRRPPPTITHPRQIPPKPKFNSSLNSFLSSFININEEDTTLSNLEAEAKSEAAIREQVDRFRTDGRFIPGTDVLFGTARPTVDYTSPKRLTTDIWDHIVEAMVARGRSSKQRKSAGKHIASQIASKVQAHFDGQEAKKVKAKDAEEKRLRNLARSTMKLVIAEWKKAVFHIREKERLEHEAEERRLGRAHLDAILDQSGQLLETQQGDLTRGDMHGSRSRSGSIRDFDAEEDEEEEDEDDSDEDEGEGSEDGDDEQEEEQEGEGEDENAYAEEYSTQTLLGVHYIPESEADNDGHSLFSSHSVTSARTSRTPGSDYPEHDDPDVSTRALLNGGTGDQEMDMESVTSFDETLEELANPAPESSPQRLFKGQEIDCKTPPPQGLRAMLDNPETHRPTKPNLLNIDYSSDSESQDAVLLEARDVTSEPEYHTSSHLDHEAWDVPAPQAQDNSTTNNTLSELCNSEIQRNDMHLLQDHVDTVVAETGRAGIAPNGPEKSEEEDADDREEAQIEESERENEGMGVESQIPDYLKPYAVAPVEWDSDAQVKPPPLLRGALRPYQQSGLEWLASLHVNKLNGILADEMGLGKTIQTIALLAHLACDRGIWGPHLIVVPTSVLLNWEMEFKKFLPGFRVMSYHGTTKRRKELRQGWNDKHHFNVCITSYTLASRDAHIFKRKAWYYMILDEAHMIKNFKSQRWNLLLMFRSYRRLLLTGTPLQNNLTELWALLQFLMSGANFANLKEFGEWFSNPLEKAIEMGGTYDDETMQRVSKLHTVLRPYLLRRLKRDVEKELPSKFEHLTLCPLSKRQRFLYDEFMSRAQTRDALESGVYQKIANILMQLRKVCNHPDLFEVRPIVTSFVKTRSAIADFEIKELLVRRRFLSEEEAGVNLDVIGLRFITHQNKPLMTSIATRTLDATTHLPLFSETPGHPPPKDTRTVAGFRKYSAYLQRASDIARWSHIGYLNTLRCSRMPIYGQEMISVVETMTKRIVPFSVLDSPQTYLENVDRVNRVVKSYETRSEDMASIVDHFAFVTPAVVSLDLPRIALAGFQDLIQAQPLDFDRLLHRASVKLQIAFPDPFLLQYDCGKLQRLATLLREKKAGGHRILIFTQMTRILDILEIFLNFHGYLYLRLDGATKIEDRQYITERFNADPRIFCFIASSRSGGVGINLTGADTVIFYDSDFNPQMDRQCEDRAHRIGQIRDVHIYRFVSQFTVEEAMLLKANQKRSLDDLVIQKGEFDWRSLLNDEGALTKALGDFEDVEDRRAAMIAAKEEINLVGADEDDFGDGEADMGTGAVRASTPVDVDMAPGVGEDLGDLDRSRGGGGVGENGEPGVEDDDEEGGSVVDYMLGFIESDYDFFRDWRL